MFKTYKASAGSGKTTHLVAEYLALCLKQPDKFKNILAITFTNNATAEMKERIVKTLYDFAFFNDYGILKGNSKAVLGMLKIFLNLSENQIDTYIRGHAKILLETILYDYANFSVCTIDSFFQKLIRSFAIELDMNLHFNLEIDKKDFFAQTIDLLINKISAEDAKNEYSTTQEVMQLVYKTIEDTGKNKIENALKELLYFIDNEDSFFALKKIAEADIQTIKNSAKELIKKRNLLKNHIITLSEQGEQLIQNTGLSAESFYYKEKGPFSFFKKMKGNVLGTPKCYLAQAREKGISKDKNLMASGFESAFFNLADQVEAAASQCRMTNILAHNLEAFILIFELKQLMDDIKREDNLFFLSDSNAVIYDKIKDEDTPFIYEKIGSKYSHYLIDEFQDTSNLQWNNLLPLIRDAVSSTDSSNMPGVGILFGDVKQAIYRFRNGDASLFNALTTIDGYKTALKKADIEQDEFENIPLTTNYRSSNPIIFFNNDFFSWIKNITQNTGEKIYELAEEYYDDVVQQTHSQNNNPGLVTVEFLQEHDKTVSEQECVVRTIKESLLRGFSYRDIAILTTSNDKGAMLGKVLASHDIPVISSDSLLLNASSEVRMLIGMMQYLVNPENQLPKLTILHYLTNCKNDSHENTFENAINTLDNQILFSNLLKKYYLEINIPYLRYLPLYALYKELIKILDFNKKTDIYLITFSDIILEYTEKKSPELVSFLDWWEQNQNSQYISPQGNVNAITLMTVHKAKGLQFPVVIFPHSKFASRFTKGKFWYDDTDEVIGIPCLPVNCDNLLENSLLKQQLKQERELSALDTLNVMYVAHTRPAKCLHIITSPKRSNYGMYVAQFIQQSTLFTAIDEDESVYYYGDLNYQYQKKHDTQQNTTTIQAIHTSDFSFHENNLLFNKLTPNSPAQNRGNMLHQKLASIQYLPLSEKEKSELVNNLSVEDSHILSQTIQQIEQDPQLLPFFSQEATVLNEIPIVDAEGLMHRPDRVSIMQDSVMVIDYKTGKENQSYEQQLNLYLELLKNIGYKNVTGRLVYLSY